MISNIVFEGGGVKGIAYSGSIKALEEANVLKDVKRVGGTSVGAIVALMVAINMNANAIEKEMRALNLKSFKDNRFFIFRDLWNLFVHYGWNRGEALKQWLSTSIYDNTSHEDLTFKDLKALSDQNKAKELYLIGANLSTGFSEIFSYETTPNMKIVDAVRISMSLPFFFSSVKHKVTGDVYVDGGLFDNYPIDLFDDKRYLQLGSGYYFNYETIGFKLESSADLKILKENEKPERKPIKSIFSFFKRLVLALLNNEDNKFRGYQMDKERTIIIDSLDIRTTDFELTEGQKTSLFDSGYVSTIDYLKNCGYFERK